MFASRAWLFALIAAVLSTLAGAFGSVAQGQPLDWKVTAYGVLTTALVTLAQVFVPSKYNEVETQGAPLPVLNLAKKKSFSWGGLLNGALTAGAQIAAGGSTKQAVPIILTSVLAAITGGAAYVNTPEPQPRNRDTMRWPPS